MLGHMKKPLTEIKYQGPANSVIKLTKYAEKIGFKRVKQSDFLKDVFPELKEEDITARILKGAREKENITQKELSILTNIPQGNISKMENGKRKIGIVTAKKLGEALKVGYKIFL